jgi:phosphohistidine swiveling domain-containing protein
MNAIRKHFPAEIERLKPMLRRAYQAILEHQVGSDPAREGAMRAAIAAVVPVIAAFKPFIPRYKQRYIELLEAQEALPPDDLIVCFDRAIYELHARVECGAWAHLPWSAALRALLAERQESQSPAPRSEVFLASGLGIGRTCVEGTARVIVGRRDFGRVQTGDLVVCPMTDPDIVIVAERIAGLITDRGGLLCHAAIIARAWNVPCLVGCRHATTSITDGVRVRLDPVAGIVVAVGSAS